MNYKYKGYTPVKDGDKVQVRFGDDDEWRDAKVKLALASQFTAKCPPYEVGFFFYADKGVTWRPVNETSQG